MFAALLMLSLVAQRVISEQDPLDLQWLHQLLCEQLLWLETAAVGMTNLALMV